MQNKIKALCSPSPLTTSIVLFWVLRVFRLFSPSTGKSVFPDTTCNLSIPFFKYLRIREAFIPHQSICITEPDLLNTCHKNLNDPIISQKLLSISAPLEYREQWFLCKDRRAHLWSTDNHPASIWKHKMENTTKKRIKIIIMYFF